MRKPAHGDDSEWFLATRYAEAEADLTTCQAQRDEALARVKELEAELRRRCDTGHYWTKSTGTQKGDYCANPGCNRWKADD